LVYYKFECSVKTNSVVIWNLYLAVSHECIVRKKLRMSKTIASDLNICPRNSIVHIGLAGAFFTHAANLRLEIVRDRSHLIMGTDKIRQNVVSKQFGLLASFCRCHFDVVIYLFLMRSCDPALGKVFISGKHQKDDIITILTAGNVKLSDLSGHHQAVNVCSFGYQLVMLLSDDDDDDDDDDGGTRTKTNVRNVSGKCDVALLSKCANFRTLDSASYLAKPLYMLCCLDRIRQFEVVLKS
uniref:Uncharacterized protein n=1 Tax=Strigamia maritima TaxID=126957 RepID=T1J2B9_STRMM